MKFLLILAAFGNLGFAQTGREHWVATWTTAQTLARLQPPAPRPEATTPPPTAPAKPGFSNQTVRMIVHTSIGGKRLRIKLASAFGSELLVVSAAHVASHATGSAIVPG